MTTTTQSRCGRWKEQKPSMTQRLCIDKYTFRSGIFDRLNAHATPTIRFDSYSCLSHSNPIELHTKTISTRQFFCRSDSLCLFRKLFAQQPNWQWSFVTSSSRSLSAVAPLLSWRRHVCGLWMCNAVFLITSASEPDSLAIGRRTTTQNEKNEEHMHTATAATTEKTLNFHFASTQWWRCVVRWFHVQLVFTLYVLCVIATHAHARRIHPVTDARFSPIL